jgi:GlpG protein
MRLIGTLADQHDAATFVDYLLTLDVSARAERSGEQWELWILDEDRIGEAKQALTEFTANRGDPKYRAAAAEADQLRRRRVEQALEARRKQMPVPSARLSSRGRRPVTMMLLFATAAVFLVSEFGRNTKAVHQLYISEWIAPTTVLGRPTFDCPEIRHGEVWRIFSPMLVHLTILHFVFNMFMFVEFGTVIEERRGSIVFAGLVAFTSAVGNLAQLFVAGPSFGGMSGVVYGLFGYLMVKSEYEPHLGFFMQPITMVIMGAWLVAGLTGLVEHVANATHLGGFIAGAVFAGAPILFRAIRRHA